MRWMGAAVAVAALALVAAGCGGSSNESSSATETTSTETESSETTSTETESSETTSTETEGSDTTGTETSESTGTTGSTDEVTGLTGACKDMAELGQKYSDALAKAGSGADNDLSVTADAFTEFADQVPEEIRSDFQKLAEAVAAYAKAVQGLDLKAGQVPSTSDIAKLSEAAKSFNAADVTTASANITAWVTKNCGTTP